MASRFLDDTILGNAVTAPTPAEANEAAVGVKYPPLVSGRTR
jgi:hypothetical protein